MAGNSPHVNVPTTVQRGPHGGGNSEPVAGKTTVNSPHVNVPLGDPSVRDGRTAPFEEVAAGDGWENPTEWGDSGPWQQT